MILRIAGTGVTPFGPANQERLIQVLAYGAGNISSSAFSIVLIADAYSSRRRALLSWPWEGLVVSCTASLGSCLHALDRGGFPSCRATWRLFNCLASGQRDYPMAVKGVAPFTLQKDKRLHTCALRWRPGRMGSILSMPSPHAALLLH